MPQFYTQDDILVLISHGSGGVGAAEYNCARYFLQHGYRVGLLDYFSKWNIPKLFWNYKPNREDDYYVTFDTMLTKVELPDEKIVHIGFSLGGYFGILNNQKFYKNFCFYPGILGLHNDKNYDNTTVIIAEKDNWCTHDYKFKNTWYAKGCYHGFMIPCKDKTIPVAKYKFPSRMTYDQYVSLMPNHNYLTNTYGYTEENIRLLVNEKCSIMYLNQIKECL